MKHPLVRVIFQIREAPQGFCRLIIEDRTNILSNPEVPFRKTPVPSPRDGNSRSTPPQMAMGTTQRNPCVEHFRHILSDD